MKMKIIEKINKDFISAFKAREMDKKNFLGVLKTEVTKESKEPTDEFVIGKIKSMMKNAAKTNSLNDMELDVLNVYLPKQLTEKELTEMVKSFISDNNLSNKSDMGKIMGYFKSNFDGEYDGKILSKIVMMNLK